MLPKPQTCDMSFLTPTELAQHLRASKSWVYQHLDELGGIRIHGLIRFKREDIDEYLENKGQMLHLPVRVSKAKAQQKRIQNQGRGETSPRKTQNRGQAGQDANRHGLFGGGEPVPGLEQAETC